MSALKTNGAGVETARDTAPALTYATEEPSHKGAGWVLFASIMFAIAAGLNIIWVRLRWRDSHVAGVRAGMTALA